jgi:hypothetical protein
VHFDHLGSSSVITNHSGAVTKWYEYIPFGEILMEQSFGDYNNVCKSKGKELALISKLSFNESFTVLFYKYTV